MIAKHRGGWKPRLSTVAERDYAGIIDWTIEHLGSRQAERYRALIKQAHAQLADDPFAAPTKARDDLGTAYRTLHLRKPGRHILVYRIEAEHVLIVRILHDSMDLARHLPGEE